MATSETNLMTAALEAQDEITALEKQRVALQQASTAIAGRLAEIQSALPALKIAFAREDTNAGATLKKLEVESVELSHRRDGIRLSLEALEQEMVPLHRTARERAEVADRERQDGEVQRIAQNIERRISSAIEHHRAACEDFWYVSQAPEEARAANLDESHRSSVFAAIEQANNRVVKSTTTIVNENWQRAPWGPRRLEIVAARPGARKG